MRSPEGMVDLREKFFWEVSMVSRTHYPRQPQKRIDDLKELQELQIMCGLEGDAHKTREIIEEVTEEIALRMH